jgi:hypothetical protein
MRRSLEGRLPKFARPRNRLAYAFYATSDAYAIAVLVFVRLLRKLGVRGDADLLVLHRPLPPRVVATMREMGLTTMMVPAPGQTFHSYYRNCLVKLRIFQLAQYDRVLYVDVDALPLKSLDHLFEFSFEGPVAAPSAYWLPQPFWTSALLLVRPSLVYWNRLRGHFVSAYEKRVYDMEIVNAEFGSEISTLPLSTFCLFEGIGGPFYCSGKAVVLSTLNCPSPPTERPSRLL